MRIVGGSAKGRRLAAPKSGTRPTSDRAREGLFNTLTTLLDIEGAHVLDLFAGTGAVGLEALSRGAATAVFVESGRRARVVLERNIADLGLAGAQLVARPVAAFLDSPPPAPFDFVFADPPYALSDAGLGTVLDQLAAPSWLSSDAVVVVERSGRSVAPRWPEFITSVHERRYGEAVLWYGRRR